MAGLVVSGIALYDHMVCCAGGVEALDATSTPFTGCPGSFHVPMLLLPHTVNRQSFSVVLNAYLENP